MSARRDLGTTAGMGQGPHRSEETAIKGGYGGAPGRGVSSAWPLRITPAAALGRGRARRIVERNVVAYRRGWVFLLSGFFEPFFYLLSIGVGLNRLVGTVPVDGRTLSYAAFVAPGLLASSAMNGALFDATFNVFFNVKIQ